MAFDFKKYKKIVATLLVFVMIGGVTLVALTPGNAEASVLGGAMAGALLCAVPGVGWAACGIAATAAVAGGWFFGGGLDKITVGAIGFTLLGIFKLIFYALGTLLSLASFLINYFIDFGLTSAPFNTEAITKGWTVVRDISNIFFLFILLYISITTIVGKNGANTYKLLGQVIAAALLINFSLALGRTVIDSSNILANEFWQKVNSPTSSFSGKILAIAEMNDLGGEVPASIAGASDQSYASQAIMYLSLDIFMITALIVLLFGAFLFLGRFISLSIILVLAPVAFIGSIIPATEAYAKEWWLKLFNQAFVAPAFLFFVYLALFIASAELTLSPGSMDMASAIVGIMNGNAVNAPEAFGVFIKFGLSMGFMVAAVMAANKLGGTTAKLATAATGAALGMGAAGVAGAGQLGIGRVAASVAKSTAGSTSAVGVGIHGVADTLSKSSFDFTKAKIPDAVPIFGGTQLGQKAVSGIAQATGIKIAPEVKTAGFVQGQKEKAEKEKKEDIEYQKKQEGIRNEAGLKTAQAMPMTNAGEITAKNTAMQAALKKFSADDIVGMKEKMFTGVDEMVAAKKMPDSTVSERAAKDDAIHAAQKQISDTGMLGNLDSRAIKALEEKGDLTWEEKSVIRGEVEKNKGNLSGNKYYKDVKDEEEEANIKNTIVPKIEVALTSNLTELKSIIEGLKTGQLQHLPSAMLANPEISKLYSGDQLEEIAKNIKKLVYSDRKRLTENARTNGTTSAKEYLATTAGKKTFGTT